MPRAPMRWTLQEDEILRREALLQLNQGCVKDWNRIAAQLPGRNNKDCRKRWYNKVAGGLRKGPWQAEEDSRLKAAIKEHGQRWTVVAPLVGTRSAEQCAKRWIHSLDPALDHSEWTPEEDQCLLNAAEFHGRSWKDIQRLHYPGRSRDSIKNRYTILGRKAEALALSADYVPCCPQLADKGGWTTTPEDSSPGTGFCSERVTPFEGSAMPSPREDTHNSLPLSRVTSHTQSCSTLIEHQQQPAYVNQTPSKLTDSSTVFTMSPPMSSTTDRSSSVSLAPGRPFEIGDVDHGLFADFNLLDAWSASSAIKGDDMPLFSDTTNGPPPFEGMTAAWMSSVEQHSGLVNMHPNGLSHASNNHLDSLDPFKQSRIRLTMERPTMEITNAVIEHLLNAGTKVSMKADANSTVTLILEDVMTETVNTVLGILFRTKIKIHMEAN